MKNNGKGLLAIHSAVLLFALAGIIGRSVTVPAVIAAFARVLFSSLTLFALLKIRKTPLALRRPRDLPLFLLAGGLLALHWTSFLQSVQVAGVAVGTITFSIFPLFVTLLEPLVFREKARPAYFLLSGVMLAGVCLLAWGGAQTPNLLPGVLWGMVSSLTYALLSLQNRSFSQRYPSAFICLIQQSWATLLLLPSLWLAPFSLSQWDLPLLLVLGVVCTALAHTLYVRGLRWLTAQAAGLISGMESVYGILLALVLLREVPQPTQLLGAPWCSLLPCIPPG